VINRDADEPHHGPSPSLTSVSNPYAGGYVGSEALSSIWADLSSRSGASPEEGISTRVGAMELRPVRGRGWEAMAQALLMVIRDEDAEASDGNPTDVVGLQGSGATSQGRGRGEPP
jgi:hypothetical protein